MTEPPDVGCQPSRIDAWDGVEATAEWRLYARRARGLLHVAAAIHAGHPAQAIHWRAAFEGWREPKVGKGEGSDVPWWTRTTQADQRVVVDLVNCWLLIGGAQPRFRWRDDTPALVFHTPSLGGAIALQRALAISQTTGVAICSGCAQAYIPRKQPAQNRRRYCGTCQDASVPLRDAQRARRARLRTDRL